ncbi:hypothetical protein HOV23_gp026 [Pseudomonas phage Lana]|uniref:Uncharacterized protein n=1 Tax=Pseudomonas phage Lana TaxID=2530172 RepID=A0A481W6N5_9CAUD|nr:hypothetical protein HOV23_gp026 [Pseudomonas phage Lana]QBJ04547.1 hypothetical protein [Pseudomonas phage Lana]
MTPERCPCCGHVEEATHWNPPGSLAPVSTWMYIKVPAGTTGTTEVGTSLFFLKDTVVIACRTRHLSDREGLMEYKTLKGDTLIGKFSWTHA